MSHIIKQQQVRPKVLDFVQHKKCDDIIFHLISLGLKIKGDGWECRAHV